MTENISQTHSIFFTTIESELDMQIYLDTNPIVNINSVNNRFCCNESDVIAVITNMKNSSAGADNIPSSISKEPLNTWVAPLTYMINRLFEESVFPN